MELVCLTLFITVLVSGWWSPFVIANVLPEFIPKQEFIVIRLEEGLNTPAGSVVHKLSGKDWDGDTLTFYVGGELAVDSSHPGSAGLFKVVRTSKTQANLILTRMLDREETSEYIFEIFLTDRRTKSPSSQTVMVIVVDTNDNYPVFDMHQDTFSIPENSIVPQHIATFHATDVDEGPNGEISYSLKYAQRDAEETSFFNLIVNDDADTAELQLRLPLDFEKATKHVVHIVARDNPLALNETQKETVIAVTVNVLDVNDQPPVFLELKIPAATVAENVPVGSSVVPVLARDGDKGINGSIVYELRNNQDKFSIEPLSGLVRTRYRFDPDHSIVGTYKLLVRATESELEGNQSLSTPRPAPKVERVPYAEMEVVVQVTAIWGSPHFKNTTFVGEIPENSPPGFPVVAKIGYLADVYDHDKEDRDLIKLTVEGDAGTFGVIPKEGFGLIAFQIVVKDPTRLDYEKLQEVDFYLIAKDSVGNKTQLHVSVFITDENDNPPVFTQSHYVFPIPENPSPGLLVGTVQATDKDSGFYGQQSLRYVRLWGLAESYLELDEMSGKITVVEIQRSREIQGGYLEAKSFFDREKYPEIYMNVEARDNMGEGNVATAVLILQLEDENDNSPQFSHSIYETEIFENQQDISLNIRIQAFDADKPGTNYSQVMYSLHVVTDNPDKDDFEGHLDIDSNSGVITLKRAFDFESVFQVTYPNASVDTKFPLNVSIHYIIKASDLGNPPHVTQAPLTIYLRDTNDCTPEFNPNVYNVTVREDINSDEEIVRVTAQDRDVSFWYRSIVYRLSTRVGTGAPLETKMFVVNLTSGVVKLEPKSQLDYDLQKQYILHVECWDELNLKAEPEAVVQVTVLDVNNKPPVLIRRSGNSSMVCPWPATSVSCSHSDCYNATIPENTPGGVKITQVMASDPDSYTDLRFHLDYYGVDSSQGWGIKDLKDYLVIDPVSGVVFTGSSSFDYETRHILRIPVVVEDIAGEVNTPQMARAWLLLNITNVNDLPPTFSQDVFTADIEENSPLGADVLRVTAVGDDKAVQIFYSIEPEVDSKSPQNSVPFKIDPKEGAIRVNGSIDREKREWYNFTVIATTRVHGTDKLVHASVPVHINLQDVNDNTPIFTDLVNAVSVMENTPVGSIITQVKAVDPDQNSFGKVTYLLDENSSLGKFSIDPSSGGIRVSGGIDREQRDSYQLNVTAIDNYQGICTNQTVANGSNSVSKVVYVHVQDANDQPPQFHFILRGDQGAANGTENSFYMLWDNVTEEQPILAFYITDDDQVGSPNSAVTVTTIPHENADSSKLFTLQEQPPTQPNDSKTWALFGTRPLLGFDGNYTVLLKAEDAGIPPQATMHKLVIQIKPSNTLAKTLRFAKALYTAALTPGYPQGSPLVQVMLTGYNKSMLNYPARVTFTLKPVEGDVYPLHQLFSINPKSGLISNNFEVNKITYPKAYYSFSVSLQWSTMDGITRRKAANVTIYLVSNSQKVDLLSHLPWKGVAEGNKKGYQLASQLEQLFGLIINVESVPKMIVPHNAATMTTALNASFLVSVICPRTNQLLEHWEILKIFQHSLRDLQKIFERFQIITSPSKLFGGGGYKLSQDNVQMPSIFWKINNFFWGSGDDDTTKGAVIYEERLYFTSAEQLYLYYTVIIVCVVLGQVFIIVFLRVVFIIYKRWKRSNDPIPKDKRLQTIYLDHSQLFLLGSMQFPPELKKKFCIRLDQDDSLEPEIPDESDC